MDHSNDIEILLVEDNPQDAEMTMRALRKCNFLNKLFWVKDGVEALEFVRCTGVYERRNPETLPKVMLLDLKMPRLGVNGFVTKPVQFSAFMEAVAQIGMYWLMINQNAKA